MPKSNDTMTPNFFSIIPANVRYSKELSSSEKIFYSEISALTCASGVCYATNAYFEKLYNVDTRTITRWLNKLNKLGFINIKQENNKRVILLVIKTNKKKPRKKAANTTTIKEQEFKLNEEQLKILQDFYSRIPV